MKTIKIICPFCQGTGRVKELCCDEEFVFADFLEKECPNCDGVGYDCEVAFTVEEVRKLEELLKQEDDYGTKRLI